MSKCISARKDIWCQSNSLFFCHYKWLSYFQQFSKSKSYLSWQLLWQVSARCNLKQSRKQSLNNRVFNGTSDRSLTTVMLCLTPEDFRGNLINKYLQLRSTPAFGVCVLCHGNMQDLRIQWYYTLNKNIPEKSPQWIPLFNLQNIL